MPNGSITRAEFAPNLPAVIQRYLSGESVQALAAENGLHRQRLYEWMLAEMGAEEYQDAVTSVLVRRISESDAGLEDASIEPDTARAIARCKFARLDFERRRPHLYGQRPTTVVSVQVNQPPALPAVEELVAGYHTIDNKE